MCILYKLAGSPKQADRRIERRGAAVRDESQTKFSFSCRVFGFYAKIMATAVVAGLHAIVAYTRFFHGECSLAVQH